MKIVISKIILSDRYTFIPVSAAVLIVIVAVITFLSSNALERNNEKLMNQLKEMQMLREDLIHIRDIVESQEKKIGLTKVSGVVSAFEQIFKSLGIEAKILKPLDKRKIKEFTEEDAEVEIENLDINKIVNLLYKIENSPVPLKIKNVTIKTTFEKRDILTMNMTASLISK